MSNFKKTEKGYEPELALLILVRLNRALTGNALQLNQALAVALTSYEVKANIPARKLNATQKLIEDGSSVVDVFRSLGVFSTYQLNIFELAQQKGIDYSEIVGGLVEDLAFEKDYLS